jgi:hypothetical protein
MLYSLPKIRIFWEWNYLALLHAKGLFINLDKIIQVFQFMEIWRDLKCDIITMYWITEYIREQAKNDTRRRQYTISPFGICMICYVSYDMAHACHKHDCSQVKKQGIRIIDMHSVIVNLIDFLWTHACTMERSTTCPALSVHYA